MKRTVSLGFISVCCAMIVSGIIIAAGIYSSSLTSWTGSRFWYAVFGSETFGYEANLSMNLGPFFIISSIMLVASLLLLVVEYIRSNASPS